MLFVKIYVVAIIVIIAVMVGIATFLMAKVIANIANQSKLDN